MLWSGQGVSGLVWHVWARWCCFVQVFPSPWLGYDACVNVLKPAVSGLWGEGLAPALGYFPSGPWPCGHREEGKGQSPADAGERLLTPWPPAVSPMVSIPFPHFMLPSWPRLPSELVGSSLNVSQSPS